MKLIVSISITNLFPHILGPGLVLGLVFFSSKSWKKMTRPNSNILIVVSLIGSIFLIMQYAKRCYLTHPILRTKVEKEAKFLTHFSQKFNGHQFLGWVKPVANQIIENTEYIMTWIIVYASKVLFDKIFKKTKQIIIRETSALLQV